MHMLEKKKALLRQNVNDNNEKMQEKLAEVLEGMDKSRKTKLERSRLPIINEAYIDKKLSKFSTDISGVFDEYVKSMILKISQVSFRLPT